MNIDTVYDALHKSAGWQDAIATAAPGVATAGSLYALSGLVPGLKKRKWLRGVLAGLGGTAASYGMYKHMKNRLQTAEQNAREQANKQHTQELSDVSSQLKGIAGKLGIDIDNWDNATMASHLSDMRSALNNATPVNVQHLDWKDLQLLEDYLRYKPNVLNKIKAQNNFVMPFMNKSIYDTTPRTISKGNTAPFTPEQARLVGYYKNLKAAIENSEDSVEKEFFKGMLDRMIYSKAFLANNKKPNISYTDVQRSRA